MDLLLRFVTFSLIVACAGKGAVGQAFPTVSPPRDELYLRLYTPWSYIDYCTLTADVFQSRNRVGRQRQLLGCSPPSDVSAAALLTVHATELSPPSDLERVLPMPSETTSGVALVVDTSDGTLLNLSFALAAIGAHNQHPERVAARVDTVVLSSDGFVDTGMGAASEWDPAATNQLWDAVQNVTLFTISNTTEVWRRAIRDGSFNRHRWSSSSRKTGQSPQMELESSFAMHITKYEPSDEAIAQADSDGILPNSCLTDPAPTCLPIGGQSVFGSTLRSLPSLLDDPSAPSLPPLRTVLLVVPSTTTALFHGLTPGANAAASGIAAVLAVLQSMSRDVLPYLRTVTTFTNATDASDTTSWMPTQVAVLLSVADEYGAAGSGRFVRDSVEGVGFCKREPQAGSTDGISCALPWTHATNFTRMAFEDFTHVIELNSVGRGGTVYVHTDRSATATNASAVPPSFNFASTDAQRNLSASLLGSGAASESTRSTLPPTSVAAFYPAMAAKNARLVNDGPPVRTSDTSSFENTWQGRNRFSALAVVASFDETFDRCRQASCDTTVGINIDTIHQAASAVARALSRIWATELEELRASGVPAGFHGALPGTSNVNITLAVTREDVWQFWNCYGLGLNCSYLTADLGLGGLGPGPVGYYPGVFGFQDRISVPQQTLFYAVNDLLTDNVTHAGGVRPTCDVCPRFWLCLRGRCVLQHAWYQHALAPAIEFVRSGYVYFEQWSNATDLPPAELQGGASIPLMLGLPAALYRHVYVESNWAQVGARSTATATNAATAWSPAVACATTVLVAVLEFLRRRFRERLLRNSLSA